MNHFKKIALLGMATLTISCNSTGSKSGPGASVNTSGGNPTLMAQELGALKVEVSKVNSFLFSNQPCTVGCGTVPKANTLIKPGHVNAPSLRGMIFGFDKVNGYSWNQLGYFSDLSTKEFLEDLLENQVLPFDLSKLCALIESLPKETNGKFLTGSYMVNFSAFPIEEKCGILPTSLNMDGIITVEDSGIGNFQKIIKYNGGEIHYGNTSDKIVYGEFGVEKRNRMTIDKVNKITMIEKVVLTATKDSLIRIFHDEVNEEASMLVNFSGLETAQFTYAIEANENIPRYGKLNLRAESLGGVDSLAPQGADCIELNSGLVSTFDYSSCPVGHGLSINDSNSSLFSLSFPAFPTEKTELDFQDEQEIFLADL